MNTHEFYMNRCIQLAKNGLGTTYPNPLVGSVIVHNGKIIGEGWHRKAGEPHAEVHAVASVKDKSLLKEATIYVSLEPCSHFGKTPPCCDLIIAHEIPNVVVGTVDPFSEVSGSGIQRLKDSGKNVIVGVLEKECQDLNERFFTFHTKKRPYIILKWAESKDGFIAPITKEKTAPVWITNTYSRQLVHKWRTEEQGILVGTQTVLDDNPSLDARDWKGNNPVRIIFDKINKIPDTFSIKNQKQPTILLTESKKNNNSENCIYENTIFDKTLISETLKKLHGFNIQSILVEGGAKTLQSFIDENSWDEARVFIGDINLEHGIKGPKFTHSLEKEVTLGNDQLKIYKKV